MDHRNLSSFRAMRPNTRKPRYLIIASITILVAFWFLFQIAAAGPGVPTITIDTTEDGLFEGCEDGLAATKCSLRDAIVLANSQQRLTRIVIPAITDGASTNGTSVFVLSLQGTGEDASKRGDLDIKKNLELVGQGAGQTVIVGVGDRIFEVLPNVDLKLSNVTLRGGRADTDGGAIRSRGTLEIANSVIIDNQAAGNGGAIWSDKPVSIVRSAIVNNSAAGSGGGISADGDVVSLINSTISGNTAGANGGGIDNFGSSLSLSYVTLSNNAAAAGGGLNNLGTTTYESTIIAGNSGGDCSDSSAGTTSSGHNLFGDSGSCVVSSQTDLSTADPLLAPLALAPMEDMSSETYVHELLPGSPALDKIPAGTNGCNTTVVTDQRAGARPLGLFCDIGAHETLLAQTGPIFESNTISVEYDGVCGFEHCSLREAIEAANARTNDSPSEPDQIHFSIPGDGPHVIAFSATDPLPDITEPLIIDGTTQLTGTVVLDGSGAATCGNGLTITAGNSTVRGLEIQNFCSDGVEIDQNGGNTIEANTIHNNSEAGVNVVGSSSNSIQGNSIYGNGAGITLNPGTGANNNQEAPTLTVSIVRTGDYTPTTDIGGFLNGIAYTDYQVEVFANEPDCTNAQGKNLLHSAALTTDDQGLGTFLIEDLDPLVVGTGVTATATDPAGNTSEFSTCDPVETLNDSWLTAKPLANVPPVLGSSLEQVIFQEGQPAWFRFPVNQDGKVTLTVNGRPGTIVTLHRNLFDQYETLSTADNPAVLAASDLPAGYLPAGYLPAGYLPAGYLPAGYLPAGYLPAGYLPAGYLPAGYLPAGYLPAGYLPAGYLPAGYLPAGYLPAGYLPAGYLPAGYLPELYSGAIRRSVIAIAYDPAATRQTIERHTWDMNEELYVQIGGPASLTEKTSVTVTFESGFCEGANFLSQPDPGDAIIVGDQPTAEHSTLILWDSQRMAAADPGGDVASLETRLEEFAARSEVNGVVIDLAEQVSIGQPKYPRVAEANGIADSNLTCVTAKNDVAREIKRVVDAYRAADTTGTLEYIVLVGSDYEIPYFRYPDEAGLANENEYDPPVLDFSPSQAALRRGQVLGQDAYGAEFELTRSGYSVPLPQLAVGRLLRSVAQVSGMIDAYVATNGVVTPETGLATGYDFVSDAGEQAKLEFEAGLTGAVDQLITPKEDGLNNAWTADQLRAELINKRHDLVFMAGHYSAGALVAADYQTEIMASEIASGDFTNSIILALGCHGGYNIPDLDSGAASPDPDWPETFAATNATLVASTGYAYADTERTEYGERLFLNLIQRMRTGNDSVAIGQALISAKLDYFTQHPTMEGIDDKTVLATTLFGFPMLRINMPGSRINVNETSIVGSVAPVAAGPGAGLGLQATDVIQLTPALTRHDVELFDPINNVAVTATYFEGSNGVVARPAEPLYPRERRNVKVDNYILRGVGFYNGTFTDLPNLTPLTSAPSTENSRAHPAFFSDVPYPSQTSSVSYVEAIGNGPTWLNVTAAQYQSTDCASTSGTMRTFSQMGFVLYYLEKDWLANGSTELQAAGLAAGPDITHVSSAVLVNDIQFNAVVQSDPAAEVQKVWITWYDPSAAVNGTNTWQSFDLTQAASDPTLWGAVVSTADVPTSALFMVQAVNSTGLVSQVTNDGRYFAVGQQLIQGTTATTLVFQTLPVIGAFGGQTGFEVKLTSGTDPIAGEQIILALGGQRVCAVTDQNGIATFSMGLSQAPGIYALQASFRGTSVYAATTSATEQFEIVRDTPQVSIEPSGSITIVSGEPNDVAAVLTDSAGKPLPEKTISFVASKNGIDTDLPVELKTDLNGRVNLGLVGNLDPGTYSLTATFGGYDETSQGLFDDVLLYNTASAITNLTINIRPVANAGGPYTVDEGGSVQLDGSGTDEGTIISYAWDFNSDGSFNDASGSSPTFSATGIDGPGSQIVALQVTDDLGATAVVVSTVTINNVAPTATFSAPAAVDEGSTFNLSLTGASDPSPADETAGFEYAFDCGDGGGYSPFSSTSTISCSTADSGEQTVMGMIRDKDGGVSEYSANITVNNVAPTATFSALATVNEGESIALSLTNPNDPGPADTTAGFEYAFDCDDGNGFGALGSASSTSCPAADSGGRTVRGMIQDKDGGVSEYSTNVTVNNVAPTATFSAPAAVNEGSTFNLSLTGISDPSPADVAAGLTYAFDCGDGRGYVGSASTISCSTADSGGRTVRGMIQDKDGGVSEYSTNVTVNNVAPTATFSAPAAVNEGELIALSLTNPNDPSPADTTAGFEYAFDCGDESGYGPFSSASSTSCPAPDSGGRIVKGMIRDKDGGLSSYSANVTINNAAPTVGLIQVADTLVAAGSVLNASAAFADAGILDTHTALWDWGDGSTSIGTVTEADGTGTASDSHIYGAIGVYIIKLTITDNDGGQVQTVSSNLVVYVAGVGKVSGGGRVNVPAIACGSDGAPYCTSGGNANFGFDIQYAAGSTIPQGQMTFSFKGGDLSFSGVDAYDVLAVAGNLAVIRGRGTLIDKNGNTVDAFYQATVIDAEFNPVTYAVLKDHFGIKLWYVDSQTGQVKVVVDTARSTSADAFGFGTLETGNGSTIKFF